MSPDRFRRTVVPALAFMAVVVGSAVAAAAGTLSPALAAVLGSAPRDHEVAVIAVLADQLDVAPDADRQISKRQRRIELVRELRTRARTTQQSLLSDLRRRDVRDVVSLWAINAVAFTAPVAVVSEVAQRDDVASLRLDATVSVPPSFMAEKTLADWNLDAVRAPELWARGITGAGVTVAIVDTGVDPLHQDLADRFRAGPGSWYDPYGEHDTPHDSDGHGTRVAGLILGGRAGASTTGVAPAAEWVAVKIFDDSGHGSLGAIHQGLQWLLDPDGDPATDDAPDVVNCSWGFPELAGSCDTEFEADLAVLRAADLAVVWSAGNQGPQTGSSVGPADNPGGFAVGAVDWSGVVAQWSSRGPSACDGRVFPDVVAPGVAVRTADLTLGGVFPDASAVVDGTSFAAAHVSGIMALLLDAFPSASVAQLEAAVTGSALDLDQAGPDNDSGYGQVDASTGQTMLAALVAPQGEVTVFADEGSFDDALVGLATFFEGFEDEPPWNAVRSSAAAGTHSAGSITHHGITWTSNHVGATAGPSHITTVGGPARSGDWALSAWPHGNPDASGDTEPTRDGFVATSDIPLLAVGFWLSGSPGSRVEVIVDGDDAHPIALGPVDASHRFYGVAVEGGLASFEVRETEGRVEDPKLIWVDDVTLASRASAPTLAMTGVVAGVAAAEGANGADWHSDLFLHNASQTALQGELYFSPAGSSVDRANGVSFALAAGQSAVLEDVVSATFGEQGSGAIFWRVGDGDAARLLVSATTYNRIDQVRRYGQQVPGVRWDRAAPAGTPLVVPALAGRYRSNVGFSTDASCTRVQVRVFDRYGSERAGQTLDVQPLGWTQLGSVFRQLFPDLVADPETVAVDESLHRFELTGLDGRIVAYASIIDNASNDGSYLTAQRLEPTDGQSWLSGAARTAGQNASMWVSDLILINGGAGPAELEVELLTSEGPVDVRPLSLAAGTGVVHEDVLGSLFDIATAVAGSLRVTTVAGVSPMTWMRTLTREEPEPGALTTYGQAIAPRPATAMIDAGHEGRVTGFSHDATTRSNLVLQNGRVDAAGVPAPSAVRVEVLDGAGAALHETTYQLGPGEYRQHNLFIDSYGLGHVAHASLRLTLVDDGAGGGAGGVDAMVSEVNGNQLPGTNDGRVIPAEVLSTEAP